MPICNNVFRRGATYYWRKRVPGALRFLLGLEYLIRSLETRSPEEARRRARIWTARVEALFDMVRQLESLPTVEFRKLAQAYVFARAEGIDRMIGEEPLGPFELDYLVKDMAKWAKSARRAHAMNDVRPPDRRHMHEFLQAMGIEAKEGGDPYRHMQRLCLDAEAKAVDVIHKRLLGEPVDLPSSPEGIQVPESLLDKWGHISRPANVTVKETPVATPKPTKAAEGRPFSVVFADFLAERERSKAKKTNNQDGQTVKLVIGLLGDRQLDDYETRELASFQTTLMRLPARYAKAAKYRGLSLPEIITASEKSPNEKRLSAKTINRHCGVLRSVCQWAKKHGDASDGTKADGLWMDPEEKDASKIRPMFEREDLQKLFSSPAFTGCASEASRWKPGKLMVRDANYWVPLLGLYAGLRLEEACQLLADDIREEEGAWVIRVTDEGPGQKLKNASSKRLVPVHSILKGLGFLDYAQKQRAAGRRLFPQLRAENQYQNWSPAVGKWFARYMEAIGLKAEKPLLVFHSLRHSFDTFLHRANVQTSHIGDLMGHKRKGETAGRYFKGFEPAQLVAAIEMLDYGIPEHTACRVPNA